MRRYIKPANIVGKIARHAAKHKVTGYSEHRVKKKNGVVFKGFQRKGKEKQAS